MTVDEFIKRIKEIESKYKTVYMLGTIGQRCTNDLINSQAKRNDIGYWYNADKVAQLSKYANVSWAFDCVGLIKAVLWGWTDTKAPYATNGVPDINETTMINSYCTDVSTDFTKIEPGEVVWLQGHIGVYIGNGEVVECTPKWNNCVQITWLQNLGTNHKYNNRMWTKHGKLKFLEYSKTSTKSDKPLIASSTTLHTVSNDYLPNIKRQFSVKITADSLNVRTGAGTANKTIKCYPVLTKGNAVDVIDSIMDASGDTWYCVHIAGKYMGYVHSDWCKRL